VKVIITPTGEVCSVYSDDFTYCEAGEGKKLIMRASHVEPTMEGEGWGVDLSPVGGPSCLGVFEKRKDALAAEVKWLEENLVRAVNFVNI
jgi:hypothetical protein